MIIVGAGFAGLIAAHVWQRALCVESAQEPVQAHKALLRFRSDVIARLVGIDFTPVQVHKGIWYRGRFVAPDIQLANMYATKCLGALAGDRSIWKTEPATRWIAPENLYEMLVDAVNSRISWSTNFPFSEKGTPTISTAPMPIALQACGIEHEEEFNRAPITVSRFRVRGAAVHQTVYFPSPDISVYRASITGSLLIVEHAGSEPRGAWLDTLFEAFHLPLDGIEEIDRVSQRFGKIHPLPAVARKRLMYQLTREHNVYSLGRFATWRNILLDDLVQDASVIKLLINRDHDYDLSRSGM